MSAGTTYTPSAIGHSSGPSRAFKETEVFMLWTCQHMERKSQQTYLPATSLLCGHMQRICGGVCCERYSSAVILSSIRRDGCLRVKKTSEGAMTEKQKI
eukprot:scaffold225_cov388-Prasinococcus_capsulatus_cf.AAC.10